MTVLQLLLILEPICVSWLHFLSLINFFFLQLTSTSFSHLLLFLYLCAYIFVFQMPWPISQVLTNNFSELLHTIPNSCSVPLISLLQTSILLLQYGPVNCHACCVDVVLEFPITALLCWIFCFVDSIYSYVFGLLSSFWRSIYSCIFLRLCIQKVKFLSHWIFGNFFYSTFIFHRWFGYV